jgi:hypothetical protein
MRYATPAALRAALDARLLTQSRESGISLDRLRRRAVFERILTRLHVAEPGRWVLKGGMALEVRWRERARATRDLDLALRDGDDLRGELADALSEDPDGDWFEFDIPPPRTLPAAEAGWPSHRFSVDARLAGRTFAGVTVDVAIRPSEVEHTERLRLPGVLAFAGAEPREIEAVDRMQHFAEKLHALTRTYGDRPNTRVKDLPDLVLLIGDGLQPTAALRRRVERVFGDRANEPLPDELADPPAGWAATYAEMATDLDVSAATVNDAMTCVRSFWAAALHATEED